MQTSPAIFPILVTKIVYIRKSIKRFRSYMSSQKLFLYELRIHFVPFLSNFDPSPKQLIA